MNKIEILKELDWILTYNTPIVPLSDSDNNLFVKKEDNIPFSFGGNKCRIAASYFKDLITKGCDVVITYGASSSNLCRVIANMSSRYGVKCVIVTPDEQSEATCNSEMVEFLGAKRIKCPLDNVANTIDKIIDEYKKTNKPYFIYGGGHGVLGTESYRDVIRQIDMYEKENNLTFDYIFMTLATGTSMSGLVVENELGGYQKKVYGVSIARSYDRAYQIMKDAIKDYDACLDGVFDNGNYKILGDYACGGYGKFNEDILDLIREEFKNNGLNLDSTYTGKAFYGMKDYLSKNNIKGKNILFIHTGGTPLFFKNTCKYLNN